MLAGRCRISIARGQPWPSAAIGRAGDRRPAPRLEAALTTPLERTPPPPLHPPPLRSTMHLQCLSSANYVGTATLDINALRISSLMMRCLSANTPWLVVRRDKLHLQCYEWGGFWFQAGLTCVEWTPLRRKWVGTVFGRYRCPGFFVVCLHGSHKGRPWGVTPAPPFPLNLIHMALAYGEQHLRY